VRSSTLRSLTYDSDEALEHWCKTGNDWFGFETMQRLPLSALRAFAAVYESGGVRPAARTLQVTHSSVSRHLHELEAWLGVALLENRGAKGRFALTPQGEALGKAALAGLAALTNAVEGVRELRRANSVVIATTASFAVRWLLPRLALLQKLHPWIEVSMITQQAVQNLAEQGADLAIRMGSGPWLDGKCEPIMDDALYPVASRRHWNSIGERQPGRALAKARLLHDRDPSSAWERWFAVHPLQGVDLRAGTRFTSSDLVLRAAAEGLGVALARDRLAVDDLATGVLFRPFGNTKVSVPRAYWLVQPPDEERRPAVLAVAQWIKAQARPELVPSECV
jgi:LysR family glycine cleavage system transcriptional activator